MLWSKEIISMKLPEDWQFGRKTATFQ